MPALKLRQPCRPWLYIAIALISLFLGLVFFEIDYQFFRNMFFWSELHERELGTFWHWADLVVTAEWVLWSALRPLQFLVPIFAGVAALRFQQRLASIFVFQLPRAGNYRRSLRTLLWRESVKMAASIFAVNLLLIAFAFSRPLGDGDVRMFLADVFGKNFYLDNPLLYYVLEGFVRSFVAVLVYSALACAFALFQEKKYQAFLSVLFYFYGLSILTLRIPNFSVGSFSYSSVMYYLGPAIITAPGALAKPSTLGIFASTVPALLITACLLWRATKKGRDCLC